jgi:DNA-binding MurR/RpiR family transcriptional regulator
MEHPKNRLANTISLNADKFTPSDRIIADYLLRAFPLGFMQNASEIADELNINTTTVTRFFPKIGYTNIKEARTDFRQDIQFMVNSPLDRLRNANQKQSIAGNCISDAMEQDFSNIETTLNLLNEETINTFFSLIEDSTKTIYVLGTRKELSLAYYFSIQISFFRENLVILSADNVVNQLADMKAGDILVVFDFRRYSRLHEKASQYAADVGAKLIIFADSPIAPSLNLAHCHFLVNTVGPRALDSYTAGMTLINVLLTQMLEKYEQELANKQARVDSLNRLFDILKFHKEFPVNSEK